MIPKIIHYCWFGKKSMNNLQLNCIESWRMILPDFKIIEWNESNFDVHKNQFTSKAFHYGKYAFVADLCRLHALYDHGGIYMDLDMLVLKNLEPFLNNNFFLGFESKDKLSAGIIGASPKSETIKKLINIYNLLKFDPVKPVVITDVFNKNLSINDIKVYNFKYFYCLPYHKKSENYHFYITKDSYTVHLWNHSWKSEFDYLWEYKFFESLRIVFYNHLRTKRKNDNKFYKDYYRVFLINFKSYIYSLKKKI